MPGSPFSPMVGTDVGVNVLFVDDVGTPTDPTDVLIQAMRSDGSLQTVTVTNTGIGIWRGEFLVDWPGTWVVQARGEGALVVTDETSFTVRRRAIS